jgi:hypothetical protein
MAEIAVAAQKLLRLRNVYRSDFSVLRDSRKTFWPASMQHRSATMLGRDHGAARRHAPLVGAARRRHSVRTRLGADRDLFSVADDASSGRVFPAHRLHRPWIVSRRTLCALVDQTGPFRPPRPLVNV